jgi:hypothetical protein
MADEKLTGLTSAPSADDADLLYIVDVSDTTDDPTGSSKQITVANALAGKADASHTHTKSDITDFSDGDYATASHTHTLTDITDFDGTVTAAEIDSGASTDGQVLTSDGLGGSAWEAVSGGSSTLDGLTDTTLTSPSDGQVLTYDNASSKWINAASAGGGGKVALETITNTTAGTFDFNSISGDYRRLHIHGYVRSDTASTSDRLRVNLNGTTTGYRFTQNFSQDSGSGAAGGATPDIASVAGGTAPANEYSSVHIIIEDYADTVPVKNVQSTFSGGITSASVLTGLGFVRSSTTAAVTRVQLLTDNDPTDELTGKLTLYGED